MLLLRYSWAVTFVSANVGFSIARGASMLVLQRLLISDQLRKHDCREAKGLPLNSATMWRLLVFIIYSFAHTDSLCFCVYRFDLF